MKAISSNDHSVRTLSFAERQWLDMQLAFGVDVAVAEIAYDYKAAPAKPTAAVTTKKSLSEQSSVNRVATVRRPLKASAPIAAPSYDPAYIADKPATLIPKAPPTISSARSEAAALAMKAQTLDTLRQSVANFDGCALKATASNLVFGAGVMQPAVMVIGESPGTDEDRSGEPFTGASGRLMLRALEVIGLRRNDNMYLSNVVYWRPPADRTPNDTEIATCLPFLCRQIELVQPKIILLAGARSAQSLLGLSSGITRLRGTWASLAPTLISSDILALPMFHPAYLFRNHAGKRLFWHDILSLRTKIDAMELDVPWPESGLAGFGESWQP